MSLRPSKFFAVSLVVLLLLCSWMLFDGIRPYLGSPTPATVDILPGTSTLRIAEQLQYAGAIRNRMTFLWLHYLRPKQTLKAGEYVFDHPVSVREVLRKLVSGEVATDALIVPEGFNRFEIADLVEAGHFATREEFLKATTDSSLVADLDPQAANLEGYLFPDTYQFPHRVGPVKIVRAMVNRFRQVYSGIAPRDTSTSAREIVTMASLVEEETGAPQERPLVASVFYNRLERDIPLQCDPTVVYAAVLQNNYDGKIGSVQLKLASPYNTYLHSGLPPGPIANPGKASLLAALHPASSEYLYFVANSEGHHTFSKTLEQHNLAVSLYRRSLLESSSQAAPSP